MHLTWKYRFHSICR